MLNNENLRSLWQTAVGLNVLLCVLVASEDMMTMCIDVLKTNETRISEITEKNRYFCLQ